MTIGIYKLVFKGTDKVYIGQSIHIERRRQEHISSLKNGRSRPKLQEAYNSYGLPELHILCECNIEDLNSLEREFILKYNSFMDGFNSTEDAEKVHIAFGEDSSKSIHTNEVYRNILKDLAYSKLSHIDIANKNNSTEDIVAHISAQKCHTWLNEDMPIEWDILKRKSELNRCSYIGKGLAPIVISPEGVEYEVLNCTEFAKEHKLQQSRLSDIITGKRKTHKGWHSKGYEIPKYPKIVSPEGIEYEVPYMGASKFASEHNLSQTGLSSLLNGRNSSHKGWRRVEK